LELPRRADAAIVHLCRDPIQQYRMPMPLMPDNASSMLHPRRVCAALCCALLLAGCGRPYVTTDHGPQAYYQTAYPAHNTSRDLEQIFRSVKRIQVTGFYETFRFAADDRVTAADLQRPATYAKASERFRFDHAKAGTATVISRTTTGLRLVTNWHVTHLPDTVVAYYERDAGAGPRYVESVAILLSRASNIVGIPGTTEFHTVASDTLQDLALIGVALDGDDPRQQVPVLRVRAGDPGRLAWASFVYVLGYPGGHMMVTRAIVSDPRSGPDRSFLLDGLFNRGISGGLILAVRGDTGELEWVGLATSAAAEREFRLVPEQRTVAEQGILLPYEGRLYTEGVARINYGITYSVSMTAIARFLRGAGHPFAGPPDGG
jgi:hypothetical protein